jgi:hypothetical protein
MSVTVICHGCGEAFPLPEGHTRNKVQCPGCGVICPVPAGAAPKPAAKGPAARKAAPAPTPSFDPLAAEPPPPVEKPRPVPSFNPFDAQPEPGPAKPPPRADLWFPCRRCGRKVRRQGECPSCNAAPEPEAAPGVPRLELDEEPPRPAEGEEEGTPYLLADKLLPRCPKCRKEMAEGAVLCVACGFDLRRRKKAAKEYEPLARSWETNMPLGRRLFWWGLLVAVVLVGGLVGTVQAGASVGGFLAAWLFFALLMAFLVGTFDRVDLTRDRKGRVAVTRAWRFCFVPAAPRTTEVYGFEGVVSGQWADAGFLEWFVLFALLPMGLVPGALWWYFVIHQNAYHVALARDHGYPACYVYRGRREEQMRDVAEALCAATGLRDVS